MTSESSEKMRQIPNLIPHAYDSYLIDMNYMLAEKINVLRGRKKEMNRMFVSLMKTKRNNVVLLGDNGVGKSATVEYAIHHILEHESPIQLANCHFVFVNLKKMLVDLSKPKSSAEKKIERVFEFILMDEDSFIVVIDQIDHMFDEPLLMYYLSVMLSSNVKLIGISLPDEFQASFGLEPKLYSMFDIINISEPTSRKIYPMIRENVNYIGEMHGVTVSEDLVLYANYVSKAFKNALSNPGSTIDALEKAMIVARRKRRSEVTRKDINYNFNFDYEMYNRMSEDDKRITAYHEAGHYIVSKMSNIKNHRTIAITIVPSENFLGVAIFESEMEKQTSLDLNYYIDHIASDLGGRVAEILLHGEEKARLTSGASADLKNATLTAREVITEYGMIDDCGENRTFLCNYDAIDLALLSEDTKVSIDKETKKLIREAFDRAKEILTQNRELLDLIAEELLINEILDEKDLDRLCSQVQGN